MNEFTQEPFVFSNETDSSYDVGAGIIFRKSGVYDVTITGNKTIVSKVSERKTGKWIWELDEGDPCRSMMLVCSICGSERNKVGTYNYCHICGAKMINARGDKWIG